jgi:DNA polymerase family A
MTPAEYILDDRFEVSVVAVSVDGAPSYIVDGPDFPAFLAGFDPAKTITITYNALFDNCILAWRYGFVPYLMIDAMGMVRSLRGHELTGVSLEKVAEHLGVGSKGTTLGNVKGMRREQIKAIPHLWNELQRYCINDNELCRQIYDKLAPEFPKGERRVMDLVLRAAVIPQFRIDVPLLEKHLQDVREEKEELLVSAGVTNRDALMSADGFKGLLEDLGVEVEYKVTAAGNEVPAFAKTDDFMEEISNHDDPRVQALAAARLGHKSTLEETRSTRLLSVASLPWMDYVGFHNAMPIPLRYAGAHTQRLSGDWKLNMQNLPTGRGGKSNNLRKSLVAVPGHKVVVADLGQIEARLTAWLCGQDDLLAQFARGEDPYAKLASKIFGFEVDRAVHEIEGFIGKGGVLGLGFGAAAPKFYTMVIRQARTLGQDIEKLKTVWTPDLAYKSVGVYRRTNSAIVDAWGKLDFFLETAWVGNGAPISYGPIVIGDGYVEGPGGLRLRYVPVTGGHELKYKYGGRTFKIYGAKFLENIIQFLARIVFMNAALRLYARNVRFILQVHDELVFIVPDEHVDLAKKIIYDEMIRRPSWAPNLPLKVSIGSGQSYGDAK